MIRPPPWLLHGSSGRVSRFSSAIMRWLVRLSVREWLPAGFELRVSIVGLCFVPFFLGGLCFIPATSQLSELGWRHVIKSAGQLDRNRVAQVRPRTAATLVEPSLQDQSPTLPEHHSRKVRRGTRSRYPNKAYPALPVSSSLLKLTFIHRKCSFPAYCRAGADLGYWAGA